MFLPLSAWVDAKLSLPERFLLGCYQDTFGDNWFGWVVLEEVSPLHEVNTLNWVSLEESREATKKYIADSSALDGIDDVSDLDREQGRLVIEELGDPPYPCLPIYCIAVGEGENERIVYIGKTKSSSRFSGGHSAALKLHDPAYKDLNKTIYRCSIWFRVNEEYVAIDWIEPSLLSLELLDSIESQLIYNLQPELNVGKRSKATAKYQLESLHIQNFSGTKILNDHFIF